MIIALTLSNLQKRSKYYWKLVCVLRSKIKSLTDPLLNTGRDTSKNAEAQRRLVVRKWCREIFRGVWITCLLSGIPVIAHMRWINRVLASVSQFFQRVEYDSVWHEIVKRFFVIYSYHSNLKNENLFQNCSTSSSSIINYHFLSQLPPAHAAS